ncbi:MAG: succinyl-diaminopimelate desuccinylase [Holosporales bacterium]|jgi:succinyl-diaminopimelate desuccinylase|nr:succinyl-diaminopimelate desuccinylase [Holosporales bacterium]
MINQILDILSKLVSCRSISPNDDGAIQFCKTYLERLGFMCEVLTFSGVNNLYAKLGNSSKNLCFAGHVDVVPPMDGWSSNPFDLVIKEGKVFGRGTNDMKGPLASCLSSIQHVIENNLLKSDTSVSVLLTSDEEIMGDHGTKSVVNLLRKRGEKIAGCVLCESCSPYGSGEYIKIGCRGSLNVDIESKGTQCHIANAPVLGNHIHNFIKMLDSLCNNRIDRGNERFVPSSIQLTSLQTSDNPARNIVPSKASALLNVRFNDEWTFDSLEEHIKNCCNGFYVSFFRFGYPFIGSSTSFTQFLSESIAKTTGKSPEIGTDGGNSDAIFIKEITDVVEIGSPIINAHIADEFIELSDLERLHHIYKNIILNFS